jgi:hypothetical protein
MTFAARFLGLGGNYTVAPSFTITTGSNISNNNTGTRSYQWYGWSSISVTDGTANAALYPSTNAVGSVVAPGAGDFKGSNILGVISHDDGQGVNPTFATVYYVYLLGSDTSLTISTLSIGGTSLSFSGQSATPDVPNNWVRIALTPTTITTTLFGASTGVNKAILIT